MSVEFDFFLAIRAAREFGMKTHADAVARDDLHQISSFGAEHVKRALKWIRAGNRPQEPEGRPDLF